MTDGRAGREDILAVSDVRSNTNLTAGLISLLRERGLDSGQLGLVGEDLMPLKLYRELLRDLPGLDLVDADSLVAGLRIVKSPAEQQLLRRAGEIACAAHAAALATIGDGVTEAAVGAAGTTAALTAGADFVRFFRVHSGDWSLLSSRWPPASARAMRDGDVVTMDVIGAHGGYGFDVLRTTVVGAPSPEQRCMLDAVARAVVDAVALCRAGVSIAAVVAAARAPLVAAGWSEVARTFVGHGIGLETVEDPFLMPGVDGDLQTGMVLCVEPGVYVPGLGGCSIEQELVVTDGAPDILTTCEIRTWSA